MQEINGTEMEVQGKKAKIRKCIEKNGQCEQKSVNKNGKMCKKR